MQLEVIVVRTYKPFSSNKNIRLRLDEEVFAYELILRQVIFEADTMSNSENCSRWFYVLEKRIPIFPLSILFLWKSFCSVDGEFHFFPFCLRKISVFV